MRYHRFDEAMNRYNQSSPAMTPDTYWQNPTLDGDDIISQLEAFAEDGGNLTEVEFRRLMMVAGQLS